jgi:hypothetical protein
MLQKIDSGIASVEHVLHLAVNICTVRIDAAATIFAAGGSNISDGEGQE